MQSPVFMPGALGTAGLSPYQLVPPTTSSAVLGSATVSVGGANGTGFATVAVTYTLAAGGGCDLTLGLYSGRAGTNGPLLCALTPGESVSTSCVLGPSALSAVTSSSSYLLLSTCGGTSARCHPLCAPRGSPPHTSAPARLRPWPSRVPQLLGVLGHCVC